MLFPAGRKELIFRYLSGTGKSELISKKRVFRQDFEDVVYKMCIGIFISLTLS
jgi:hypothetical protein